MVVRDDAERFPSQEKEELVEFLKRNTDVFA